MSTARAETTMGIESAKAAARQAVDAFLEAFNRADPIALAGTLNYPHIRFAGGTVTVFANRAEFIARRESLKASLQGEGWHRSVLESIEVVHADENKVHLSLRYTRRRADDSVYNEFHTLWIATCQNGHWGIQFRSSYLS